MTDKQIADQLETLRTVGKEARASKETAKQFLKDAGITTYTPSITLAQLQSVIFNAPYLTEYQKQQLMKDITTHNSTQHP